MVSGKYSALSGAITREQSIANTSANLANVNTVGYKKMRMSFEAILDGQKQIQDSKGVNFNRVRANYIDFSQGPIKVTDNPLDVAIRGDGFFKVRAAEGDLLTRGGNFTLDNSGRLQTPSGMAVLDDGGAEIVIPEADINRVLIDQQGILYGVNPNGDRSEIARLAVVDVEDRTLLKNVNNTAYSVPPGTVEFEAQNFQVKQGSLESSNVNMTDEMTKMMSDSRLFETYHNVIERYSKINDQLTDLGSLP